MPLTNQTYSSAPILVLIPEGERLPGGKSLPNGRLTYPNMAIGIQIAAIGAGFNRSSGLGNNPSFASKIGAR